MSAKMSTKMSTKMSAKLNMDDEQSRRRRTRNKYKNETLLQEQRRKEKELLKQWKAARDNEKKSKLIIRKQAHDVSRREKERFSETDETDYEFCGAPDDRAVFKCCPRYREHNSYYA